MVGLEARDGRSENRGTLPQTRPPYFSEMLAVSMQANGDSRRSFAQRAGVSASTVGDYLGNLPPEGRIGTLKRIARTANIPLTEAADAMIRQTSQSSDEIALALILLGTGETSSNDPDLPIRIAAVQKILDAKLKSEFK